MEIEHHATNETGWGNNKVKLSKLQCEVHSEYKLSGFRQK